MKAIEKQNFDSEVFGFPFYRVKKYNIRLVKSDFIKLKDESPIIIDAKIDSNRKDFDHFFQQLGFKKVCMQAELELTLDDITESDNSDIKIDFNISWPDKIIKKHAKNFIYDRFSLDYFIDDKKKDLLFYRWIKNSLLNKKINIIYFDNNFCSFKEKNNEIIIDLISVINKGKGIGTLLIKKLIYYAKRNGYKKIKVVTECENISAISFYQKNGFKIIKFYSCFHYAR